MTMVTKLVGRYNRNVIFRLACRTCQRDSPIAPSIDHDTHYPHRISCVRSLAGSLIHSFIFLIHPSIGDPDAAGNTLA